MGAFDFAVIFDNLPFLMKGMQTTLLLTALAMFGGHRARHAAGNGEDLFDHGCICCSG